MLLIVGFVPVTGNAQTCLDQDPAQFCLDDPLQHDAGEISIVDGEVSAEANGGLVTGAGNVTFVVDYVVEPDDLGPDESLYANGLLLVRNSQDEILDLQPFSERLDPGESAEGEIQVEVETLAPSVEGGTVEVQAGASVSADGGTSFRVGEAQSVSPMSVVLAPPSDIADRTTVGDTIDVGSFDIGPATDEANVIDGELLVAQDTGVKLQATGELSTPSFIGVDRLTQRADARLTVDSADGFSTQAFVDPIDDRCWTTCSVSAQTVPVELSVVIPGDLADPVHDLRIAVSGDWTASWEEGGQFFGDGAFAGDVGEDELLAVGV